MSYVLAVDLGSSSITAAVAVDGGPPELVSFGSASVEVPAVIWFSPEGEALVGTSAQRRVVEDPARSARQFKRRVGDPIPLLIGGTAHAAEGLMSDLLTWVVGRVSVLHGAEPAAIAVCCPANWGP